MTINILGHEYKLIAEEGMYFNTGDYGKHSYPKLEITFDPDMKESVWQEAILHELLEAINYWDNTKLDHHQITLLSVALYSILKTNKDLADLIFKENDNVEQECHRAVGEEVL